MHGGDHEPVTFAERVAMLSLAREIGALAYPMKNLLTEKWASRRVDRVAFLRRLANDLRGIARKIDDLAGDAVFARDGNAFPTSPRRPGRSRR